MLIVSLLELLVAILLGLAGFFQWNGAEAFCRQLCERRERAHKIVRFLLYPGWFYKGRRCVWQVRFGAVGAMLMGLLLAVIAFIALFSSR